MTTTGVLGWVLAALAGWRVLVERADRREAWTHVRMLSAMVIRLEERQARGASALRGAAAAQRATLKLFDEFDAGGTVPPAGPKTAGGCS